MSTTTTFPPASGVRELSVRTDRIESKDSPYTSDSAIFDTEAPARTSMCSFKIPYLAHDPEDDDKMLSPDVDAMKRFQ